MDRQRRGTRTEVRALIRRAPAEYLLVRPGSTPAEIWEFPGGQLPPRTDPAQALGRWCLTNLGLELVDLASQPPFDYRFGTYVVTYHYYHCCAARDEALPLGVIDLRWVSTAALGTYPLDAPARHVAAQLQTTGSVEGDCNRSRGSPGDAQDNVQ